MRAERLRDIVVWTSVTVAVGATVGSLSNRELRSEGDSWTLGAVAIGCCALGWLVVSRRPELPIGWLLLAGGAIQAWSFLASWWAREGLGEPDSLPVVGFAAWLAVWLSPLPWPLVLAGPLVLFPDGRARSPRWRWFLIVVAAAVGALALTTAIVAIPAARDDPRTLVEAGGAVAGPAIALGAAARTVGLSATIVALAGVVYAGRRARGLERRQYAIVLVGASVVAVNALVGVLVPAVTDQRLDAPAGLGAAALLVISTAVAIAVVRYRLYNLELLVNRTVLFGIVGLALAAIYTTVLVVLARLLDDETALSVPGVVAAGAVVAATAPVVSWAAHTTRRWFGRAADPITMAARFHDELDTGVSDDTVVQRLAVTVRDELRLGSVEIAVDGVAPVVAGRPEGPPTTMALDYQGRRVGEIVVTARAGERLAEPDQRTMARLGPYLAVTAEAIRVGEDVRRAQQALEDAHVEERRRIRLDLHDGVGPTLAGIHLRLLTLRRRLPAGTSADDLVDQTADAIREVRRIVDGLQPSVLEDLGLVPALQILVADTRQASGVELTVAADADLTDLPAHLATTSYRVVAEGLANVVRHSRARTCTVRLHRDERQLTIAIKDDGCGFDTSTAAGMGLRSIAGRASAAGGDCSISSATGTGTTVVVRLPL